MFIKALAKFTALCASNSTKVIALANLAPFGSLFGSSPELLKRTLFTTATQLRERERDPALQPPAKPKSPYLRFMHHLIQKEKRGKPLLKIDTIKFGQQVAAPSWESLFESDKKPFEQAYQHDYKLYKPKERDWWMSKTHSDISLINEERRLYGMKPLSFPKEYMKEIRENERQARQAEKSLKPKGIANSRIRFMKEVIPSLSRELGNSQEAMKAASKQWNELTDDEKEPYQQAYLKERVEKELLKK
ncbi:hypothetical protein WALSEDRAFT_62153 [Wallemia mellicola CBS 633.66]|uniref:HMG box domain-containing protein n=1 Tax=Wallemia mellicola (strain ATCC MYA-4683 / CBS 633.66) TaxID=671144 RepID=I4YHP1_WALMC|nr:hypothetical protein WALSEDRAFT_62153 [Wallemia mellicola CBS 633.66]EIM23483.1 hypothetical protein WALSEDRAFT_62153 [Wallemia mellicola CBS 633.66]|eukprot:XP_006956161.1 hypothetical protein WALSEDRAFT_62153 [Wallemia mellicola CBS 633.66]